MQSLTCIKVREGGRGTTTAPTPPPSTTPLSEGNVTASGVEKAPVTRRRLDGHDACYNTYEVLLIIGLTCAVNFAFIFVVMAFVHLCNRGQQVKGLDYLVDGETAMVLPRCDSLLPLVLPSDGASAELRRSSGSYSSVQEYVNSLPDPVHGSMVSLHTLKRFPSSSSEEVHRGHNVINQGKTALDIISRGNCMAISSQIEDKFGNAGWSTLPVAPSNPNTPPSGITESEDIWQQLTERKRGLNFSP
uniref:Uncharacterized protein n=1 Tax=Timema monikensis TaxID=170555 RepID=A0A7R9EHI0_9NEOP|nr:unnamed protein product [Timema monikensis]